MRTTLKASLIAAASMALAGVSAPATASTGGEFRTVSYKCDSGRPFQVTYYFGAPKSYAVLKRGGAKMRLPSTSEGFSNGRYKLAGEIYEANAGQESVFLYQTKRQRVNGRTRTVDAMLGKSCWPN